LDSHVFGCFGSAPAFALGGGLQQAGVDVFRFADGTVTEAMNT
jgi:hypothetical protein